MEPAGCDGAPAPTAETEAPTEDFLDLASLSHSDFQRFMTGTRASIVRRFQERAIAPGGVPSERYVRTEGEEGTTWISVSDSSEPASEVSSKWAAQLAAEDEAERLDAEGDVAVVTTHASEAGPSTSAPPATALQRHGDPSTPPSSSPPHSPPKRCRSGKEPINYHR